MVSRQRERQGACDHLWPAAIMPNSGNNTVTVKPCQRSETSSNRLNGRADIRSSPGLTGQADGGTAVVGGQWSLVRSGGDGGRRSNAQLAGARMCGGKNVTASLIDENTGSYGIMQFDILNRG